jgi:zeta-carotene desaturase
LRAAGRPGAEAELDALTVEEWLLRAGQTPRLRRMLWDPLTLAIVNETPDQASALPLARALAESFLGAQAHSRMGIPSGGLSRLFEPELARYLEERGGQVRVSTRATALELAHHEGQEIVVGVATAGGDRIEADGVIAAVPHDDLPELLPEAWRGRPPFAGLPGLGTSPILSLHLWLDREVTDLPFAGLLGTRSQWVFNRRRLAGDVQGHALSVVISAAREDMGATREELVERTLEELCRLLPRARSARLISSRVIKERRATFSARPGTHPLRPGPETPIRSLCLAGDWTDTGLPATIEGAARSGFRAAERVLLSCRS